MTTIKPKLIDKQEARQIETKAINESLVRVSFYRADGKRIASKLVLIPATEELSDETIYKYAEVELQQHE